jgi:two-component system response regulator YesN
MSTHPNSIAFAHALLSGTLVHEGSFEEIQNRCQIRIHPRTVLVISMDRYPDRMFGKPFAYRKQMGNQVVEAVRQSLAFPYVTCWVAEGVLAVLLEIPQIREMEEEYRKLMYAIALQIQSRAKVLGESVSIGIGGFCNNPYLLYRSYEEAKEALIDRFFQGNQLICFHEKKGSRKKVWQSPVTPEKRAELQALIRIGDEDKVAALLEELLRQMAEVYQYDVEMFQSEVIDLVMTMNRVVLEASGSAEQVLTETTRLIQDLYRTVRFDKFLPRICAYGRKMARLGEGIPVSEVCPTIQKAIAYMKEHLTKKITLQEVAQVCSVSIYYFSHLFKRETGKSFIEYLNELRIRKAMFYLEHTDLSVQEIAGRVGFDDANYFSRLFKKYVSMSPAKYRRAKLC